MLKNCFLKEDFFWDFILFCPDQTKKTYMSSVDIEVIRMIFIFIFFYEKILSI